MNRATTLERPNLAVERRPAMKSGSADVFISHKSDDAEKAQRLKQRIETDYHLECWIDADDEEMQRIQQAQPVDYALLTHRIRERLRGCRCLIFAYSSRSHVSRWMPWELGFFDGRWGGRLIGLYDLDEGAGDETAEPAQQGNVDIREFERIYTELTPANLEGFLQYARSPRALSDRADVDIDRWTNLATAAMRDPFNVSIDAMQFWIAYHHTFWSRAFGASSPGTPEPLLQLMETMRAAARPLGDMMRPALPDMFERLIKDQRAASDHAVGGASVAPGNEGWKAVFNALPPSALWFNR
jgi:TIR domain